MTNLKRTEYIDLNGNLQLGLNKNAHAKELQKLRKKGYSVEECQEITGVKHY